MTTEEWEAQAERLLNCRTEAKRRLAIRNLLLSDEEIGPFARELIAAEYFPAPHRPKKMGNGFHAGLAVAFQLHKNPKTGKARERLIRKVCEQFGCSREEFRKHWHHFTHPAFQAALREGMREEDIDQS